MPSFPQHCPSRHWNSLGFPPRHPLSAALRSESLLLTSEMRTAYRHTSPSHSSRGISWCYKSVRKYWNPHGGEISHTSNTWEALHYSPQRPGRIWEHNVTGLPLKAISVRSPGHLCAPPCSRRDASIHSEPFVHSYRVVFLKTFVYCCQPNHSLSVLSQFVSILPRWYVRGFSHFLLFYFFILFLAFLSLHPLFHKSLLRTFFCSLKFRCQWF